MRFKGKKAVVVGAADKSIGQAIAKQLAAEGAEVCIWDINTESAGITAKAITDAKGKVKVMEVNAMEAASLKGAVEASIKEMGGIDYMVDTVGGGVFKQFAEYEDGFFEQQVAFNGFTMANCARAILPHFTEKGEGKMLLGNGWYTGSCRIPGGQSHYQECDGDFGGRTGWDQDQHQCPSAGNRCHATDNQCVRSHGSGRAGSASQPWSKESSRVEYPRGSSQGRLLDPLRGSRSAYRPAHHHELTHSSRS